MGIRGFESVKAASPIKGFSVESQGTGRRPVVKGSPCILTRPPESCFEQPHLSEGAPFLAAGAACMA